MKRLIKATTIIKSLLIIKKLIGKKRRFYKYFILILWSAGTVQYAMIMNEQNGQVFISKEPFKCLFVKTRG